MSRFSNHLPHWSYALIGLAFLLDRLSKAWAAAYLRQHGPAELLPGLALRQAYNRGIAFGLLQGAGPLVGWLTILVLGLLLLLMARQPRTAGLLKVGLALVIGGAAGNMWDRIFQGAVLDFLVSPIRPGIFNVADVLIYLGIGLTLLAGFRPATKPPEQLAPLDGSTE